MAISQLYPTQRPALDLNFARQKRLDSRVTFTRGSTATYVGSDGLIKTAASGEARFDHDPVTGESLGLLVEQSGTNHCLHSDIDPTNWVQNGTSSLAVSSVPAPDGGTCYDLTTDTGGANSVRQQSNTSAPVGTSVLSVFARFPNAGFTSLAIRNFSAGGGANYYADYRPATDSWHGEVSCTGLPSEDLGNGWKRLTVVSTVTSSNGNNWVNIGGGLSSPAFTQQTCQIWGAQLEAGSFPTSYIPTSGSTVTRSADVPSMTADPYLYGTFLAKYKHHPGNDSYRQIFTVGSSNAYGAFVCRTTPAGPVNIVLPGVVDLKSTSNSETAGFNMVATARVVGDYAVCLNGGTVATTSSSSDKTNNSVITFMYGSVGSVSGGHISRFSYYPTRLSNDQLQDLTL
jgi:hypothetical protein